MSALNSEPETPTWGVTVGDRIVTDSSSFHSRRNYEFETHSCSITRAWIFCTRKLYHLDHEARFRTVTVAVNSRRRKRSLVGKELPATVAPLKI